uniref:Viral late gene transcription factor 3 zinc ribbon domain-containing protein n=1 Tax=viral metagenome TaxID=1070528 RepID=A0A6C0JAS7_9ZZZZ
MLTKHIIIDKSNNIDNLKILEIHKTISNNLKNKKKEIDYGFYISRVYNFIQKIDNTYSEIFLNKTNINKFELNDFMNFISICREYINIDLEQQQEEIICPSCSYSDIVYKENEYICDNCFLVYDSRIPGIKEIDMTNKFKTYYSLKGNLLKAIEKFEGKGVIIHEEDIEKILFEINKRKININFLQREHVCKILKDVKLVKYYDCINVLMSKLTGCEQRSISQYIPEIIRYHGILEHYYPFVRDNDRVNSLNVQYKLYKLLRLCDVDCDISEFCTLKTEQKYEEHEAIWHELCKYTNWK